MSVPKYQIFVSSTYEDLKDERDAVIKAVLEMGHIPVGMEMFSAANEQQWKMITRQIDQSDYYIVIVAQRYGSMVEELGVSYTEREYDYAVAQNVPVLGFVLADSATWPTTRVDRDASKVKALNRFKKKVMGLPVGFWTSAEDLNSKAVIALSKVFNTEPRLGWIRATEGSGPEVAAELARLSKENDELRTENAELQSQLGAKNQPLTLNDFPWLQEGTLVRGNVKFGANRRVGPNRIPPGAVYQYTIETTWETVLRSITTAILTQPSSAFARSSLHQQVKQIFDFYLGKNSPDFTVSVDVPSIHDIQLLLVRKGIAPPVKREDTLTQLMEAGRQLFLLLYETANDFPKIPSVNLALDGRQIEPPPQEDP